MQFKSFGIQRRISRKNGRESMSAQTESCELRTLLCASVISGGTEDGLAPSVDGDVDSPIKVAEPDLNDVAPIDGDVFGIMPVGPGIDESVFPFGISDELWTPRPDEAVKFVGYDAIHPGNDQGPFDGPVDGPSEGPFEGPVNSEDIGIQPVGWDPSWIYQTLNVENGPVNDAASDEAAPVADGYPDGYTGPRFWHGQAPDGPVDGPSGEKLPVGDEVCLDDAAPVDAWDPSWAYRSFLAFAGEETENPVDVVDLDPGFPNIFHSVNPAGDAFEDSVPQGDQSADGEKLTVDDSVIFVDAPPVEGWDSAWVYRTLGDVAGDDEILYLDAPDPLPLDEVPGELVVVEVVNDGETTDGEPSVVELSDLEPVATPEWSDTDPFMAYFSAAAVSNAVELQRSNDSSNVPAAAVAPLAPVIPVRQSSSISLFSSSRDRTSVGIPADVQPNSAVADSAIPAKRDSTQRRTATQVRTATQSASVSEGLNNLTPLLGVDRAPSENDSHENTVDPQAVESGPVEEEVSDNSNSSASASGFAAISVPTRSGRAALIDRVMAQYAENSFNS